MKRADLYSMPSVTWNLWHGCHKYSAGCQNCYVYSIDEKHGRDARIVQKTKAFDLPVRKNRAGEYKIPPGTMVYTCFSSDFLVEDADHWRQEAFEMMRQREDLTFLFLTKRIERLGVCLPPDWGQGYPNVHIGCTIENQDRANFRMPIFKGAPIMHKSITCEPLLEPIDLRPWLGPWVGELIASGESGINARPCHYDWVLDLRRQCMENGVAFVFKQTGARFYKDGKLYRVPKKLQGAQARKADINFSPE